YRDHLGLAKTLGKKAHKHVNHVQVEPNSSKLRFFRRLQYAYGGSRNIAMLKLTRKKANKRRVLYILARSMGLGVSKLTLRNETIRTKGGGIKKRSHSEAVLRAVLEVGEIEIDGKVIKLNKYKVKYG